MLKRLKYARIASIILALGLLVGSQAASGATNMTGVVVLVNSGADAPLNPLNATQCQTAPANTICTLRAAIMFANRNGGGTIILPALPNGAAYTLSINWNGTNDDSTGDLDINQDVNILGEGSLSTIIDGADKNRLIYNHDRTVFISGITLRNGYDSGYGGGIMNEGDLTLLESTVSESVASYGGGISGGFSTGPILRLRNSTVSGNYASISGGGIHNYGVVELVNSTVSGNTAAISPGIGEGGGIYNNGSVYATNGTISGNSANGKGGGIWNGIQKILYLGTVAILLNQGTFGQGLHSSTGGGPHLSHTIVGENSHISGGARSDCDGPVTSDGFNIVGVNNCTGLTSGVNGDLAGTAVSPLDPVLDYLLHNGGGTNTHAIKPGSPAINSGSKFGCGVGTDQRGYIRMVGDCDRGAFEYGARGGEANGDGVIDEADWSFMWNRWHERNAPPWDADANGYLTMRDLMRMRSCLDLRSMNGLVSWWKAEGNGDDALCRNFGRRWDGIRTIPGKVGQAFSLDGVDDHLEVPDDASLEPALLTLEAWVRRSGPPGGYVYIAAKGADNNAASYALYTGSDGGMTFYIYNAVGPASAETPSAGVGIWDGAWHHIAGTYDGAAVRLYVDGVQSTSAPATITIGYGQSGIDNLYIGVYGFGFGRFGGDIDEVALWSRALSATEVCQRALKPVCP